MKTVTIEYCGMAGSGRNVTEAKNDAARKLVTLVHDIQSGPSVVDVYGEKAIVWRHDDGWRYAIVDVGAGYGRNYSMMHSGHGSKAETEMAARYHLAQNLWRLTVEDDWRYCTECGLDDERARELVSWAMFQRAYREAIERGADDNMARQVAGGLAKLEDIAA